MLAKPLCQRFLKMSLKNIHKRRIMTLTNLVVSLLNHADLSITSLGRHLPGKASVKNKIRMVWDFLANSTLAQDMPRIYEQIACPLLSSLEVIRLAVDWSGCCSQTHHMLRASLLYKGRSIPIYTEVFTEKEQETDKAHQRFLEHLKELLPTGKKIIIVTDAGFKTPWFNQVACLRWYFIGRVRGRIFCKLLNETEWINVKALHNRVQKNKALYLGEGLLSKTSKTQCQGHYVVYKAFPKGRHFKPTKHKKCYPDTQKMYSQMNKAPWVIFTNLPNEDRAEAEDKEKSKRRLANYVVKVYQKRMQIEQNFRDDKNPRWGWGWRHGYSKNINTLSALCLIASLATIMLWLIGFYAETQTWHRRFQANTIKTKRVLSFINLAKQILLQEPYLIGPQTISKALQTFKEHYLLLTKEEMIYAP